MKISTPTMEKELQQLIILLLFYFFFLFSYRLRHHPKKKIFWKVKLIINLIYNKSNSESNDLQSKTTPLFFNFCETNISKGTESFPFIFYFLKNVHGRVTEVETILLDYILLHFEIKLFLSKVMCFYINYNFHKLDQFLILCV